VEGRLITVTNGTTVTVFTYDGDGKRVKQTVAPTTTVFIGNYCEIAAGTQRITTTYYYANGRRVAMRTAAGVTYVHSDHLGSTAVTSGAQSGNIRYFPYGATRSGAVSTAYKFTGQRLDDSTGLYYYGARYYDAAIGRFVQADSIVPQPGNPQALNRYSYVLNNPVRYTDPTGRWVFEQTPNDPRITPPAWPYPAIRSVSPPPEPPVLGPALEILDQTPTGQLIVQFALTHDINVWFVNPFNSGAVPWGTWIILPPALRSRSAMREPGAVQLIAHELVHAMQNVAQGNQRPLHYSLYREVEAYIVYEVLAWEMASRTTQPEATARQARKNLSELTGNLALAYANVESRNWGYRTPLFYREPTGDPLTTVGQLLSQPSFPAYIHGIIHGPNYGYLLAMAVQYLK